MWFPITPRASFEKTSKFQWKYIEKKIVSFKYLSWHLLRKSPLTIFKFFVQLHFDYGDTLCGNPAIKTLRNYLQNVQCNACLAITGTIKETSHNCFYQEVWLEALCFRRWYWKIIFFYRIVTDFALKHLFDIIHGTDNNRYTTEFQINLKSNQFYTKTESLQLFFPHGIKECNKLDITIRLVSSLFKLEKHF